MKFVMIVSLSLFKSQEQAPATIILMIIFSQRFDSISNKYFDRKFCGLERRLAEDAGRNPHNVAKGGKQSKKHFSTRKGAAESSYRPLDLGGERPFAAQQTSACGQQGHWRKFCQVESWS